MSQTHELPPEFTDSESEILVSTVGTTRTYRGKDNYVHQLNTWDLPERRVICITNNGKSTYWTESLPPDVRFDAKHHWTELGVGRAPDAKGGFSKFLFFLAHGYLSGFPITDVFSYALKFGLTPSVGKRILDEEAKRKSLGATLD